MDRSVDEGASRVATEPTGPLRALYRTFDHCDQVAELARSEGDVEFTQLSAGCFFGAIRRLELGDLRIHHTATTGSTLNRSRIHEDYLLFHVLVRAHDLVWEGKEITRQLLTQHTAADDFVRRGHDLEMVALAAPRRRVAADAAALAGTTGEPVRLTGRILEEPAAAARGLHDALLEVAHRAERQPSSLEDPASLDDLRERIDQRLVEFVAEQIGARDETGSPGSRLVAFRRALDFLDGAGSRSVRVPELCRAAGVSRRTLEYAFLEVCGVSPQRYMQARRLRQAQRALRAAEPERGAVKRVALDAGFRDLGRFSIDYRRFFGESPRETLLGSSRSSRVAVSSRGAATSRAG